MAALVTLSEADVRLRLYPSSGRVVKVTEGYWPSRLFGDDSRGGAVVYELPEPLPPSPDLLVIQQWMRLQAAAHFRPKAMGLECDCQVCRPAPRERFTNAVCSACGKGSADNIDARGVAQLAERRFRSRRLALGGPRPVPDPKENPMTTVEHVPQHMQALAKANVIRRARAEVKRQVADGRTTAAAVILDPPACAASMTIAELLGIQRGWGDRRTAWFLAGTGMDHAKTLGSMTDRQRRATAMML